MRDNDTTLAWKLYEAGRDYNERLVPSQYALVDTNTEFFSGNQWLNLPDTPAMRELPKPTFNIIKRIASLFIASLTSSAVALRFEPLAYYGAPEEQEGEDPADVANAEVGNLLEKFKFEYRLRDALYDGARSGDYCAHFWFDPTAMPYGGAFGQRRGEIRMELVDGVNVMFGNPASACVEDQPYILLVGRDTVEHLRQEAEARGSAEAERITADSENGHFSGVGGRTELSAEEGGKALYVCLYTRCSRPVKRADGTVERWESTIHVTKATRTAVIYQDVDTGLSRYPIAWGNWEKQKNQYHGRALVTGIVPNQIFINTMFATAMRHLQLMAFPKTVYNADLISSWSNEVGQAIGVRGLQPGQAVGQVAQHLQPAEMSNQIFALIDKAMAYTKECLGATDAQMGNVRPDNTSALMVLQTNAEVPLENVRAGLYEWVEDIGAILLDMMGTYYGTRPVVTDRELEEPVTDGAGNVSIDPVTGLLRTRRVSRRVVRSFDFSRFKHLWLRMRVDVGATTYFSEIAMSQTLDNLRRDGTLDVIQYLERIPDKLIPKKEELLRELRSRAAAEPEGTSAGAGGPVQGGPVDESRVAEQLTGTMQNRLQELPAVARRAVLQQGQERSR
ncbi:portal protein [Dysosmobacter sp.]|uniref:portal protein n=1 Tax=Dysosmobacter sp. TaxID=2591382 RepID=UPI002A876422|nr:hypothetical protein [Dysosmobacter sp.]MDY3281693.1 hypothetical protein [Dysosmobacter sp.]